MMATRRTYLAPRAAPVMRFCGGKLGGGRAQKFMHTNRALCMKIETPALEEAVASRESRFLANRIYARDLYKRHARPGVADAARCRLLQ